MLSIHYSLLLHIFSFDLQSIEVFLLPHYNIFSASKVYLFIFLLVGSFPSTFSQSHPPTLSQCFSLNSKRNLSLTITVGHSLTTSRFYLFQRSCNFISQSQNSSPICLIKAAIDYIFLDSITI